MYTVIFYSKMTIQFLALFRSLLLLFQRLKFAIYGGGCGVR